jgi:hypothetical protein
MASGAMRFAAHVDAPIQVPIFALAVGAIISRSAKKKMIRIHAGRRVALVTDKQSFSYWAAMQLPRESMCCLPKIRTIAVWYRHKPIAALVSPIAGPQPTS